MYSKLSFCFLTAFVAGCYRNRLKFPFKQPLNIAVHKARFISRYISCEIIDLGCRCWFTCTRFAPTSVCRVSTDSNFKCVNFTSRNVSSNLHRLNERIVVYNVDVIVFMHIEGGSREYKTKNRPIVQFCGHEQATVSSRYLSQLSTLYIWSRYK